MGRKTWCAAVMAAVLASGCGSSGPLSRKDLAKRGNEICRRQAAGFRANAAHARSMAALARASLPIMTRADRELAALKAPSDLKRELSRFIAIENIRVQRIRAGLAGSTQTAVASEVLEEEERLAQKLGFAACAGGG